MKYTMKELFEKVIQALKCLPKKPWLIIIALALGIAVFMFIV